MHKYVNNLYSSFFPGSFAGHLHIFDDDDDDVDYNEMMKKKITIMMLTMMMMFRGDV